MAKMVKVVGVKAKEPKKTKIAVGAVKLVTVEVAKTLKQKGMVKAFSEPEKTE